MKFSHGLLYFIPLLIVSCLMAVGKRKIEIDPAPWVNLKRVINLTNRTVSMEVINPIKNYSDTSDIVPGNHLINDKIYLSAYDNTDDDIVAFSDIESNPNQRLFLRIAHSTEPAPAHSKNVRVVFLLGIEDITLPDIPTVINPIQTIEGEYVITEHQQVNFIVRVTLSGDDLSQSSMQIEAYRYLE